MNVLIVGGGGREHAIAWALSKSEQVEQLYCAPGNGGIAAEAECVEIKATDIPAMVLFAKEHDVDYVVVAPDDPLALGMVDALAEAGIPAFGPRKNAAIIEASKSFSKNLMKQYGIPTAKYEIFTDMNEALAYVREMGAPIVVKADGLALGKGVVVAQTVVEAEAAICSMMGDKKFGEAGARVVIEECMTGPEVSVLCFTDGKHLSPMLSSQDHKRAYNNDEGPNTGGMGAFAPSPKYSPEIAQVCMDTIFRPTVEAMADPVAAWRGPTTTTAATVPVFFISGPIIEKLKLNPGTGTAGGENPVTNALGYFVNLVGDVVGGSVPPNFDKSTHGSSADLVAMVFTENAKENPWKTTYAEEAGFKPSDSIVTHFSAYLGNANIDHDSKTGQRLLTTLSTGLLGSASGLASCLADYDASYAINNKVSFAFIVLCPEHAATIAKDFPDQRAARDFMRETAAMPYKFYSQETCVPGKDFGPYDENTFIPRFKKTESIKFFVSGGPGKQSQIWVPFPQVFKPVSKKIAE